MRRPTAILTDIEGTTTPIAFVRDVLFGYARARLPALVREQAARPDVAAELARIGLMAPGRASIEVLLEWMDQDAKVAPLKVLQGIVWEGGYADGSLVGRLYPDVPPALARWHAAGLRIVIYSSGSVAAQRLLFAHSEAGDLTHLLDGFHDTATGLKQDPQSYRRIGGGRTAGWLFLSDAAAELDAAAAAGMDVLQVVRPADGTVPSTDHGLVQGFDEVEARWTT